MKIKFKVEKQMCRIFFAMQSYFKNDPTSINRVWYGWHLLNPLFDATKTCANYRRSNSYKSRTSVQTTMQITRLMCLIKKTMKSFFNLPLLIKYEYWAGWNTLTPVTEKICIVTKALKLLS